MSNSTALTLADPYQGSHPILQNFVVPLIRGEQVTITGPAQGDDVEALVADILTSDQASQYISLELQLRAARMFAHPPLIEIRPSDIKLMIAAYQVCWFFHTTIEEGKVWESRQRNILNETQAMLDAIGLPEDTGQIVTRHLMLRHLPRLFRTDHHLEFGFFWPDLYFYGTDPEDYVKLPGRSSPAVEQKRVPVAEAVNTRPVATIYRRAIWLSPLTNLLACDRLHPHFTFWGTVGALSVPMLCRYATNELLAGEGLSACMAPLGMAFLKFAEDVRESRAHRRYAARFIYNLILTHVKFADREELAEATVFAPDVSRPRRPQARRDNAVADPERTAYDKRRKDLIENGRNFYAVAHALHNMRGPLGAAHLLSDLDLVERIAVFLEATPVEPERSRGAEKRLRAALNWPH